MTDLLDRPTTATTHPVWSPRLPATDAAEEFYRHNPADPPTRSIRIDVGDASNASQRWLAAYVERQINNLLGLPAGWDGYRGRPLAEAAVESAVLTLFEIAGDWSLAPQIFPLADGGIQMEWHVGGNSLEIEIDAIGEVHVLSVNSRGAVELEGVPADTSGLELRVARDTLNRLSAIAAGAIQG